MIDDGTGPDAFEFRLRIKPFGKFQHFTVAADQFEIDADISSVCHCNQHAAMRVREVKAQRVRIALAIQQSRLARRPGPEAEGGRLNVHIVSKHKTETAARQCKANLILSTHEPRGAGMLLLAERGMATFEHGRIALERATPNIDGVWHRHLVLTSAFENGDRRK
jgi:hypothetical protein